MTFIDPYDDLRPRLQASPEGVPTVEICGRLHALAPTRSRVLAGLIDFACYRLVLMVLAPFWAVLSILHSVRGDDLTGPPPVVFVLFVTFTVLFFGPLTWRAGGQSVGKRFMGLRVVEEDGAPLGLQHAVLRETIPRALPFLALPMRTLPSMLDLVLIGIGVACVLYASDSDQRRRGGTGSPGRSSSAMTPFRSRRATEQRRGPSWVRLWNAPMSGRESGPGR